MNEKILDIPFENEFYLELRDGEEILWKNEVFNDWDFSHIEFIKNSKVVSVLLFYSIVPIALGIVAMIGEGKFTMLFLVLFGFLILVFLIRKKSHRTYYLTNQRMIFHYGQNKQSHVLDILLPEIKTIDVAMKNLSNTEGDILLDIIDIHSKKNIHHFSNYIPDSEIEYAFQKLVISKVKNTPKILKLIRQARLKAKGI